MVDVSNVIQSRIRGNTGKATKLNKVERDSLGFRLTLSLSLSVPLPLREQEM